MNADVRSGCLGSTCTLANEDYSAVTTAAGAATFIAPASTTTGTVLTSNLTTASLGAINRTGRTQVRLNFTGGTAGSNGLSDYLTFGEGAQVTLVITYQ